VSATRRIVYLLLAAIVVGYLMALFATRDIWSGRDGTRLTLAAETRDGSPPSSDDMAQARRAVEARLEERGVVDAEVAADGNNVVATFPGHDPDSDALREMFDPGETKTLDLRPVIHALPVEAQPPPPPGSPPLPAPGSDRTKAIAEEKQLRQSTDQSIQVLALQFQATRCGENDALTGHDNPNLPLITCSTDGKTVYLLDESILSGEQVQSATSGRNVWRDEYVVDLEFDDAAARTWAEFTAANVGTQTAFTVDTKVVSAPQIMEEIPGGRTQITGKFDAGSARALADALDRGALPVSLSFESSVDEMLPATMLSKLLRIVEITAGVGLAVIVLGAVVYLRPRR
jgi:preprotein translocase subunit SecD